MNCTAYIPNFEECNHVTQMNRVNDFVIGVRKQFPQHSKIINLYHKRTNIQSIDVMIGEKAFWEDGSIGERRANCNGSIRITYCYFDVLVPHTPTYAKPKEFILVL